MRADHLVENQLLLAQALSQLADTVSNSTGLFVTPLTFATLPAAPALGWMACITDSPTTTWGANVTVGAGANKVLLWYNGTNWTVVGK